jgi:hypothetical protein
MICAIHQPQYLPYLGFLDKIRGSDVFVFLDDCQFKKNEWQNRNRIRTKDGWQWLTIPVIHRFGQSVNEVMINNTVNWRHKHLQSLITNYGKAPYFKDCLDFFEKSYEKDWERLADINLHFITHLMRAFGIERKTIRSSELNIESEATMRLVEICKRVGADTYLSGPGGKAYLDEEKFRDVGIELVFQDFVHPEYEQQFQGFVPSLSSVDFLFNCGGKL